MGRQEGIRCCIQRFSEGRGEGGRRGRGGVGRGGGWSMDRVEGDGAKGNSHRP